MDLAAELAELNAEQLTEALARVNEELDDVREERQFVLGQTGVHIGGGELKRLQKTWSQDEARLLERVAAIQARLAAFEGTE